MKLAKNLKLYRQQSHLTQNRLANKLHVSRKTISNWENGRSQPSFQTLITLSKIYDTSVTNLLNDKIKKPNKIILASYLLNAILLISAYIAIINNLRPTVGYLNLLMFINLIFLVVNYKKWKYTVKNKLILIIILFILFISIFFNSRLYLAFNSKGLMTFMNHPSPYQVGFLSSFILIIGTLSFSLFIILILCKYIKFLFKSFK